MTTPGGLAATFTSRHHVLIEQNGYLLTVSGLAGSAASIVTMVLSVEDGVALGEWAEVTDPDGYYRGARYDGAIRLEVDADGRRMAGEWVGYGKDGEANTGPSPRRVHGAGRRRQIRLAAGRLTHRTRSDPASIRSAGSLRL